jgi:hypothetical protein
MSSSSGLKNLLSKSILLTSVNYEERTLNIFKMDALSKTEDFRLLMLTLKGAQQDNVGILEALREKYERTATRILKKKDISYERLDVRYPREFDRGPFERVILDEIRSTAPQRVLLDITGLPRKVIIALLETFDRAQAVSSQSLDLYVIYTTAKSYPASLSPQLAGDLQGLLTGKPLSQLLAKGASTRVGMVPSIYGMEARLLLEEIQEQTVDDFHAIIPLYQHDLLTGFNVLQSNSDLMRILSWRGYRISFSFSILDMANVIIDTALRWINDKAMRQSSIALIAPFNVKFLTVASYFFAKLLEEKVNTVDIIWPGVTPYNSQYSLGVRDTSIWKVTYDRNKS